MTAIDDCKTAGQLLDAHLPTLRFDAILVAFVLRIGGTAAALGLHLLLARLLGGHGYGEYVYVIMWVTLLSVIALLGMENATLRFVALYRAEKSDAQLRDFLRCSLRWVAIGSTLGGLLLAGAAHFLSGRLTPSLRDCFCWGGVLLPLATMLRSREAALRGMGKTVVSMTSAWCVPTITAVLIVIVWRLDIAPITSTTAIAIQVLVTAAALVWAHANVRICVPGCLAAEFAPDDRRQWLAVGFPLMLFSAAALIQNQGSMLLSGTLLGVEKGGVLAAAMKIASVLLFGIDAVNYVVAPNFAALHSQGNLRELRRVARLAAAVATVYVFVTALVMLLFGRQILRLFGAGFEAGYEPLLVLAVGAIVNAAFGSVDYLLTMTGHHKICLQVFVLTAAGHLALSWLLIPPFGLTGAAIASTLTVIVWNVVLATIVRRRIGISSLAWPISVGVFHRRSAIVQPANAA